MRAGDRDTIEQPVAAIPHVLQTQRLFGDPDYLLRIITRDLPPPTSSSTTTASPLSPASSASVGPGTVVRIGPSRRRVLSWPGCSASRSLSILPQPSPGQIRRWRPRRVRFPSVCNPSQSGGRMALDGHQTNAVVLITVPSTEGSRGRLEPVGTGFIVAIPSERFPGIGSVPSSHGGRDSDTCALCS
jgi:Lrp/AsnC ligand binding domain